MADQIVDRFPPAKWEVEGADPIVFPVVSVQESYRNRIVKHNRLHRDGARLDDTGADSTVWTLTTHWFNFNDEPGITNPETQYPDEVNALTKACKIHETGTLTLPTQGKRRCRAESYDRQDTSTERDQAVVTFIFVEDNEDDATQQEFSGPSASSIIRTVTAEGVESAESLGAGSFDMSTLNEFAGELEALANAPGDFVGDLDAKASAIINKVQAVEAAFTRAENGIIEETTLLMTSPDSSLAGRRLRQAADVVAGAVAAKAAPGIVATTTILFARTVSIFDVAGIVGQAAANLINLNTRVADLMEIPRQTPITVLDTPGARSASST